MSSAISYEYLQSVKGVANGIASLDGGGKIPVAQLPAGAIETYKGEFATSAALIAAFPTGLLADYAYVTGTNSYWYWNKGLAVPAWVNQEINVTAYLALTPAAKAAVPYRIVP